MDYRHRAVLIERHGPGLGPSWSAIRTCSGPGGLRTGSSCAERPHRRPLRRRSTALRCRTRPATRLRWRPAGL